MVTLYVIRSLTHNYRYTGITKDLKERLIRHNSGLSLATKGFAPFRVVHLEEYQDMREARKREKFLKSGVGQKFLDTLES